MNVTKISNSQQTPFISLSTECGLDRRDRRLPLDAFAVLGGGTLVISALPER